MSKRCVFFDRDGIVNESPGRGRYVERWEQFRLQAAFVAALRAVARAGYEAVIVTNQQGVAKGLMPEAAVADMHARLRLLLEREHGLALRDILCCPHTEGACECRKPRPGMLLEAARRHDLDLSGSWMVGDSPSDIEAGRRAGCRTILVGSALPGVKPDHVLADVTELPALLECVLGLRVATREGER